jgi:hypothetical protein
MNSTKNTVLGTRASRAAFRAASRSIRLFMVSRYELEKSRPLIDGQAASVAVHRSVSIWSFLASSGSTWSGGALARASRLSV